MVVQWSSIFYYEIIHYKIFFLVPLQGWFLVIGTNPFPSSFPIGISELIDGLFCAGLK